MLIVIAHNMTIPWPGLDGHYSRSQKQKLLKDIYILFFSTIIPMKLICKEVFPLMQFHPIPLGVRIFLFLSNFFLQNLAAYEKLFLDYEFLHRSTSLM